MIHIDLSKVQPDDLEEQPLLDKGRYTFEITGVDHSGDEKPAVKVRCKVLSGPSYIGAAHTERFALSEAAMKRFANFLKRMGLIDRGDFGQSFDLEESQLIGRRVVADVVQEDYTDSKQQLRTSSKWGYMTFWAEGDEPGSKTRDAKGKRVKAPPPAIPVGSADDAADLF